MVVSDEQINQLQSLSDADEPTFKRYAKHSAMNRIRYAQWRRNLSHQ